MNGTTLCPHCNTRFRIAGEQLEAHQGMVRCGHCMQAFDARPGFIPDQPDPQLELPIVDQRVAPAVPSHPEPAAVPAPEAQPVATHGPAVAPTAPSESPKPGEPKPGEPEASKPEVQEAPAAEPEEQAVLAQAAQAPEQDKVQEAAAEAQETPAAEPEAQPADEAPHDGSLDFVPATNDASADEPARPLVLQAPQPAGLEGEEEAAEEPTRKRRWPWITASSLLALLLLLQAMYFFRVELAARLPGLKPVLVGYCNMLGCTVPLPQNADLMSIESSELQADPQHANQITLVALLRNRATHVQAFPVLELSLNDTEDKVLARRQFKPADYLPATETEAAGLRPNREVGIRLKLDTTDLRPTGYRLALFYPK
jgi:predicted Zn finger-like uncharacterized protein